MSAVVTNMVGDSVVLLPDREQPYLLQDVWELVRDDCRLELILQFSDGHLLFRADEDNDSICFDFQPHRLDPSAEYGSFRSYEKLTSAETDILKALIDGKKTKQKLLAQGLQATAKVLGAATRNGFGKQGGGLLGRGLITAKPGKTLYEISDAGRQALSAAPWKKLLGKELNWTWVAVNQQGYCDSVMLSFNGIVPMLLLHVIASSIEFFSIARS